MGHMADTKRAPAVQNTVMSNVYTRAAMIGYCSSFLTTFGDGSNLAASVDASKACIFYEINKIIIDLAIRSTYVPDATDPDCVVKMYAIGKEAHTHISRVLLQ